MTSIGNWGWIELVSFDVWSTGILTTFSTV